jgi:predicted TIM-barrel fold metal-dependent hydrolase
VARVTDQPPVPPELAALPLRDYRPRSQLRLPRTRVTRARFPAIDAHNHLGRWLASWVGDGRAWSVPDVGALIGLMDSCNVSGIVSLDGRWDAELADNLRRYDEAHPGRFATFAHVDWGELRAPGFGSRLAASLRRSVQAGAKGLKVWKDLGLEARDHAGALVLPSDPRLGELWQAAGELGVPVAIHTADPRAFFDPVDASNERLEELLAHPDWSYRRPGLPSFDTLIGSLEDLVRAHPGTTFIGLHAGCYAEDLGWVGRLLDAAPNFHIDIAARVAELGRQPRATRALILRHPGRVLFGTDDFPPDRVTYETYFRFLETEDEHFPYGPGPVPGVGRWAISGLGLPDPVLEQVYRENAARLVPSLRPG